MCLKHPDLRNTKNRERIEQCFVHLVDYWSKDLPIKSIWIPQIKEYQLERLSQKAAPATINKEKATLSKMFQILLELKHVDVNPVRLVKSLSEKSGEREVYISASDFQKILVRTPLWFRPIALTAYYTGMRRGEVVNLTRRRLSLDKRIIYFGPDDVKEWQWKRVPIHRDLVPILEEVLRVLPLGHDYVFHRNGKPVTHKDQLRWCWDRKVSGLGMEPPPRFHDLRHTWRTNARRSGVDPQIAETIMGHVFRLKSVNERYGRISDEELLKAIDMMTFDNGETEILVAQK